MTEGEATIADEADVVEVVAGAGALHRVTEEVVVEAIKTVAASGAATEEATEAAIAAGSGAAIVVGSEAVTVVEASEEGTGAEEGVAHRGSQEGETFPTSLRLHMSLQLPPVSSCPGCRQTSTRV